MSRRTLGVFGCQVAGWDTLGHWQKRSQSMQKILWLNSRKMRTKPIPYWPSGRFHIIKWDDFTSSWWLSMVNYWPDSISISIILSDEESEKCWWANHIPYAPSVPWCCYILPTNIGPNTIAQWFLGKNIPASWVASWSMNVPSSFTKTILRVQQNAPVFLRPTQGLENRCNEALLMIG